MKPDDGPYELNPSVRLPRGLTARTIVSAVDYIERETSGLADLYFEQQNVFSAVVGIFGAKALHSLSPFEQNPNRFTAQQRFPDLRRRGSGVSPAPADGLESKASTRPWALQAHYNHEGWYIVWRYLVDPTKTFGSVVIVWRVDVVFLKAEHWKYEGSRAGPAGGGRTHTFGLRIPATVLRDKAVYRRRGIRIVGSKPVISNGD